MSQRISPSRISDGHSDNVTTRIDIPRLPMVRRDPGSRDDSWFKVYHKLGPAPYMTFGQLVHGARELVWWLRDHAEAYPNASVIGIFEVD